MIAARRLQGWAFWAVLKQVGVLLQSWQAAPPVSNTLPDDDRCTSADPAMTARLNDATRRFERSIRGETYGDAAALAPVFVSAEIALACAFTTYGADRVVDIATALFCDGRLPRLARLAENGWADPDKIRVFVRETDHLGVELANAVERIVIGELPGEQLECAAEIDVLADPADPGRDLPAFVRMTVPQLERAIAAAILAIDAEAAARRARKAREARGVTCRANTDGTGTIRADLALEAAAVVWASLTAAARSAKASGDPRTLDQLRADVLLARATGRAAYASSAEDSHEGALTGSAATSTSGTGTSESGTSETGTTETGTTETGTTETGTTETGTTESGTTESGTTESGTSETSAADAGAAPACPACLRRPGSDRIPDSASIVPFTVSLTIPLRTYLGLMDDPAQLDGYGPIPACLARQLAADAARETPRATTWRCVIVDDEHSTVLGVARPIRTPVHDPPPRLADLVRTASPSCSFPGCRVQAWRCDIDHRIPWEAGGDTCACNLQALCRRHHRLKGSGFLSVRVVTPEEDPDVVPGTLEWRTRSGLRYRSTPSPASPPSLPADADLEAVVERVRKQAKTDAADEDAHAPLEATSTFSERDFADEWWQRTWAEARAAEEAASAARAAQKDRERAVREALHIPDDEP